MLQDIGEGFGHRSVDRGLRPGIADRIQGDLEVHRDGAPVRHVREHTVEQSTSEGCEWQPTEQGIGLSHRGAQLVDNQLDRLGGSRVVAQRRREGRSHLLDRLCDFRAELRAQFRAFPVSGVDHSEP